MTEEITILVTSIVLFGAVPVLRALGERANEERFVPLVGLGLTIAGGVVLVWMMLRIAARGGA